SARRSVAPEATTVSRASRAASARATSNARPTRRTAVCSSAWPNTPLPSTDRITMRARRYQVIARFSEASTWSADRAAGALGFGWSAGLAAGGAAGDGGGVAGLGAVGAASAQARDGTLVTIRASRTRSASRARLGEIRTGTIGFSLRPRPDPGHWTRAPTSRTVGRGQPRP